MVDALDEVLSSQRRDLLEKAKIFAQELSSSLIITSRKIDIVKTPPNGFEKYELMPFEFNQAIKLCEKIIKTKQQLDTLKRGLDKVKHQVPMIPLSLMLLIELVEDCKEVPSSITELYDRFLDSILGRWDKDKGIAVLFEYMMKKKFIASLAYKEFLQKQRLEIPKNEFTKFSEEYAKQYGYEIDDFIKEIERAGVLNINGEVFFCHRSFLDYFAAFYIYEKRADIDNLNDYVVNLYFDDLFADVAFFYVGLMREVSESFLEKIFNNGKTDLNTYIVKYLAGRLLQAGWNSPTKTRSFGVEKAISFAPIIRQSLLDVADKKGAKVPTILGDFLLVTLSDISFGSGFLLKEVLSLFNKMSEYPTKENSYSMLLLLWSIQRFLNPDQIQKAIDNVLDTASKITPQLQPEDQAKLLLFLAAIEKDSNMAKTIRKKLNKMSKRFPDMFRKMLPSRAKKFE